ncbi:ATP-binding protein [Streptomyces sp. NPDC086091]|uniref:ATP-binding protein n=1 Tax=Streptomyces sp. NPDC086091 TaxID=3365751 RepID=UPI003812D4BA
MDSPSRTVVLPLRNSREGFAEAREFTQRTLDTWGLAHCTDDALTVVGELTSNAVLHALSDPARLAHPPRPTHHAPRPAHSPHAAHPAPGSPSAPSPLPPSLPSTRHRLCAPSPVPGARLRLSLRRSLLMCAVTDPSDTLPVPPHAADSLLDFGRGLHLVEALSHHWGWTRRVPVGKTVWAMLPTRPTT